MPTFAVVLRNKNRENKFTINIRITHLRQSVFIPTQFKILENQIKNGRIVKHPNARIINERLNAKLNLYDEAITEIEYRSNSMTASDVKRFILKFEAEANNTTAPTKKEPLDFFHYCDELIAKLEAKYKKQKEETGKASKSTLENYKSVRSSVKKYHPQKLYMISIDHKFVSNYIEFLEDSGIKNGIWSSIKDFKAIYNKAVKSGLIPEKLPFAGIKTSGLMKQKEPKVLTTEEMRQVIQFEPRTRIEALAKDVFLLSFYLIGVNPVDLFYIDKIPEAKITAGRFVFSRSKTGNNHSIKIEPEAQAILDKLKTEDSYIFQDNYSTPKYFKNTLNERGLWKISDALDFPEKLTLTVARHTWATIAYNDLDIAESIIDFALGHKSQRTIAGAHYIKKDRTKMDEANRAVIDFLTY